MRPCRAAGKVFVYDVICLDGRGRGRFVNIASSSAAQGKRKGQMNHTIQGKCQIRGWFIEGTNFHRLYFIVFCIRELENNSQGLGLKTSLTPTIPCLSVDPVGTEWPKKNVLERLEEKDHRSEVHYHIQEGVGRSSIYSRV